MGLFGIGKKESKKERKREDEFEIGSNGIVFNAKFQILTKSKEYAKEVADGYVKSIKDSVDPKGYKKYRILKHSISKPMKLKDSEKQGTEEKDADVYRIVLDFDVGVKDKAHIFSFCFEYMPFFIEIVEPMNISMTASDMTNYLTDIQATLHKVDADLKRAKLTNEDLARKYALLSKNTVRMLRNNILLSLKEKNKDLKELSKNVGIPEDQLEPFIDNMMRDKEIKLDKKKYSIAKA